MAVAPERISPFAEMAAAVGAMELASADVRHDAGKGGQGGISTTPTTPSAPTSPERSEEAVSSSGPGEAVDAYRRFQTIIRPLEHAQGDPLSGVGREWC